MRKALTATALVWIVVGLALIVQALLALNVPVPLVERGGAWRMTTEPWTAAMLALVGVVSVAVLRWGPGPADQRARVIGCTLGALSLVCVVAADVGAALVIAATGRMVYTGAAAATPPSTASVHPLASRTD